MNKLLYLILCLMITGCMSSSTLYEYEYDPDTDKYVAVPVSRMVNKGMKVKANHNTNEIESSSLYPDVTQIPVK